MSYPLTLLKYNSVKVGDEGDFTDINKEVVDLVTNRFKEKFGCNFPYVNENY